MPTMITRGAMSAWSLVSLGGLGGPYFMAALNATSFATQSMGFRVVVDANRNAWIAGGFSIDGSGNFAPGAIQVSKAGALLSQFRDGSDFIYSNIMLDGADLILSAGISGSINYTSPIIARYTPGTGYVWSKSDQNLYYGYANQSVKIGSNYVFAVDTFVASCCGGGPYGHALAVAASDGSYVSPAVYNGGGVKTVRGISTDGTYAYLSAGSPGYGDTILDVMKWTPGTSTFTTSSRITIGSGYVVPNRSCMDPTNSYFYTACGVDAGNALIMKIRCSDLVVQWTRKFAYANIGNVAQYISNDTIRGFIDVAVDSSGNVYCCGTAMNSGSPARIRGVIVKYDASGAIQWQRELVAPSGGYIMEMTGICIDNAGDLWVSGSVDATGGWGSMFVMKVPTDGSKTGTYSLNGISYDYQAASGTDSSQTTSAGSISGYTSTTGSMSAYTPSPVTPTRTITSTALP